MSHVYNTLNPPFHTAILLVAQPAWTPREHERLTQFFFEKFKTPAFGLMDAALATTWAYGVHTATVVDVGKTKADVTAEETWKIVGGVLVHQLFGVKDFIGETEVGMAGS